MSLSGSTFSTILGIGIFELGIAGIVISCYEITHHPRSRVLNTQWKRTGAAVTSMVMALGMLYNHLPEAVNNYGYQVSKILPSQLTNGTPLGNIGLSCYNCCTRMGSCLGGIGCKFGSLISSSCSFCRLPGVGCVTGYMPSLPSFPNFPSNGLVGNLFLPFACLIGVLVYGRGLELSCNGSMSCS